MNQDKIYNSIEDFEPQHPSDVRVTEARIRERIKDCTYSRVGENMTLCHITLDNAFEVIGESSCVDKKNFNVTYGRQFACRDAYKKLYVLFGFMLAEDIHRSRTDQSARASAVKRREEKNRLQHECPNGVIWGLASGGSDTSSGSSPVAEESPAKPEPSAGELSISIRLCPFAAKGFGEALDHLHRGGKVRRPNWSPDVYLAMDTSADGHKTLNLKRDGAPDQSAKWVASHNAMLATDWCSVDDYLRR